VGIAFQRVTLEGEYAFYGPFTVEVAPSYYFGVPLSSRDGYSVGGAGVNGKFGWYFERNALDGWFVKGVLDYSRFSASSDFDKVSFGETTLGALIGNQFYFGQDGGFTISSSIGLGVAPGAKGHLLQVGGTDPQGRLFQCQDGGPISTNASACPGGSTLRLLGQFALGYTF